MNKVLVVIVIAWAMGMLAGAALYGVLRECPKQVAPDHVKCLPPVKPINDTFGATTSALLENVERLNRCSVR